MQPLVDMANMLANKSCQGRDTKTLNGQPTRPFRSAADAS